MGQISEYLDNQYEYDNGFEEEACIYFTMSDFIDLIKHYGADFVAKELNEHHYEQLAALMDAAMNLPPRS